MPDKQKRYKGFIIICASCGNSLASIEARQDGIDFQCKSCGNKLLMRPGEVMKTPAPSNFFRNKNEIKQKMKKSKEQLELDLEYENKIETLQRNQVPRDDWANDVLDEFYKRRELEE